ncbi:ABC transporter permease [Polystyrenella longa]|uniref:ABC transporter permease n=1 Tax=Polystyrenella longa TaxID=2528007 RepID=UPI001E2F9552|nr:ABC transporter permease [Polystyrenella longa]
MFYIVMAGIGLMYIGFLISMLAGDIGYLARSDEANQLMQNWPDWLKPIGRPLVSMARLLEQPEIQYSVKLTLISCLMSSILSVLVAIPIGYLFSRYNFYGKTILEAILYVPIVLPPLVLGISLLVLFQFQPFKQFAPYFVFQIPGVVLAQFMVAAAFSIQMMRATFDQINPRLEQVALTLGCNERQAFSRVCLPQAWHGILTAGTLAWARALGEFGPLLVFAGTTRNKTEVMSVSVFLELSLGRLNDAVAVSLMMVFLAVGVLVLTRIFGLRNPAI